MCCTNNDNTAHAKWYRKMKTKMQKQVMARMIEFGEEMDCSAEPLYLLHVTAMVAAYAVVNTTESCDRAFSILLLWLIAGRASEGGYVNLDDMTFDTFFDCAVCPVPQSFTSCEPHTVPV